MSADQKAQIEALFRQRRSLTILEVHQATGVHTERIRQWVKPPRFQRMGLLWAGRGRAWLWTLVEEGPAHTDAIIETGAGNEKV
jgi:hypothetical protein